MNSNPFRPPTTFLDDANASLHSAGWRVSVPFTLFAAPIIAVMLFAPFRLIAAQTNDITSGSTDNFYYPFAIVVWPAYALAVGGILAYLASRFRIHIALRVLVAVAGLLAMYFSSANGGFLGLHDSGQAGLFQHPSNIEGLSTPKISAKLISPVYWGSWVIVTAIVRVANPDNQDMHRSGGG